MGYVLFVFERIFFSMGPAGSLCAGAVAVGVWLSAEPFAPQHELDWIYGWTSKESYERFYRHWAVMLVTLGPALRHLVENVFDWDEWAFPLGLAGTFVAAFFLTLHVARVEPEPVEVTK
jgi:hypothetical protein